MTTPAKLLRLSVARTRRNITLHSISKNCHYSSSPHFNPRAYHSSLIKNGSLHTLHLLNYLLSLYLKNFHLQCARNLFDEIPQRDAKTWTLLISGFSKHRRNRVALDYFATMLSEGTVAPNAFTLSSALNCCASLRNGLPIGKAIHAWMITNGVDSDVALANALLHLYAKFRVFDYVKSFFECMCTDEKVDSTSWNIVMLANLSKGEMKESLDFFWRLPNKEVSSWNTIINGVLQQGLEGKALELLYQMAKTGPPFNEVTFSTSLVLASSLKDFELGKQIHAQLLRTGTNEDSFTSTSLLDMYCKCGEMGKASFIFQELQQRCSHDELRMVQKVSWSAMIAGFVHRGMIKDALVYFRSMNHKLDLYTLTTIVAASANAALLELGQQIHALTLKLGHGQDIYLCSSVIDMYAKCGKLDDSRSYFSETGAMNRNIVLWSAMISSYAAHGCGKEAIELFELMRKKEGIRPNEVSFLGLLTACSHAGLVEDGCKYFNMMIDVYGLQPGAEHLGCMVDLFGRAGRLEEMKDFVFGNGIHHLRQVWKTYLSCCWLHKNVEMINWVSKKVFELEPLDSEPYLMISNTYSANHAWEEAAKFRGLMLEKEVIKPAGKSWI